MTPLDDRDPDGPLALQIFTFIWQIGWTLALIYWIAHEAGVL